VPQADKKPVIGLTGGIGAGKSLVARQLAELGCFIIDADALARDALADPRVRSAIAQRWGAHLLDDTGHVQRQALAGVVFNAPTELAALEQIIHPLVNLQRYKLREQAMADPRFRAVVEDCPLLLEKKLDSECDVTIFVSAPRSIRLARVAKRGWSDKDLADREKNQLGVDFKEKLADHTIVNDADELHCRDQVQSVLSQILRYQP